MNTYLFITLLIASLSCSKYNSQDLQKELVLDITKTEWNTTISGDRFGNVYLTIEGNTNAELLTIETYGDGLLGCKEIHLDENQNFSDKLLILFHPRFDTIPHKYSTYITAYEKSESPEIVICRTGTGKQIRKMVKSDFMTFIKE